MRQVLLQSAMVCYYKVRQLFYYKVRQVLLQSATGITKCAILLQSAKGITKCDDYYKVRQYNATKFVLLGFFTLIETIYSKVWARPPSKNAEKVHFNLI